MTTSTQVQHGQAGCQGSGLVAGVQDARWRGVRWRRLQKRRSRAGWGERSHPGRQGHEWWYDLWEPSPGQSAGSVAGHCGGGGRSQCIVLCVLLCVLLCVSVCITCKLFRDKQWRIHRQTPRRTAGRVCDRPRPSPPSYGGCRQEVINNINMINNININNIHMINPSRNNLKRSQRCWFLL